MKNSIFSIVPILFTVLGCPSKKTNDPVTNLGDTGISEIVTEHPANYPGYVPEATINERGKSIYHTPTPELHALRNPNDSKAYIITPETGGWDEVPWNDASIQYYLMTPGDYVEWGILELKTSGQSGAPKVLMYYDPQTMDELEVMHAYASDKAGRAVLIEGMRIGTKTKAESYVTISGLTLKGRAWTKGDVSIGAGIVTLPGSKHLRIVNCYAHRWKGARMYGSNIIFQDNVVGGSLRIRGDHGGVGIHTTELGSYNCRIVGNEIFDQADLVGAPKDGRNAVEYGFVNGLVIADNDLYWSDEARVDYGDGLLYNCGGDAVDIKNGSNDPNNPVLITGNRIAYCYPTPPDKACGDNTGSIGQGMVLHKDLRNTIISNNIFYHVSVGIVAYPGTKKGFVSENIVIQNNLFHTCLEQLPQGTGYALKATAPDVDFIWNTVVNAGQFIYLTKKGKWRIDIRSNRYIGPLKGIQETQRRQTVVDNYVSEQPDVPLGDLTIVWRRHTGLETLVLPDCVLYKKDVDEARKKHTRSEMDSYMSKAWWRN